MAAYPLSVEWGQSGLADWAEWEEAPLSDAARSGFHMSVSKGSEQIKAE